MLRCPHCGSESGFLIESLAVMAFNCAEQCVGNYDRPKYNDYFICTCVDCDYEGRVKEFKVYGVVNTEGNDETNHE